MRRSPGELRPRYSHCEHPWAKCLTSLSSVAVLPPHDCISLLPKAAAMLIEESCVAIPGTVAKSFRGRL